MQRVIKIGGSLLLQRGLVPALQRWDRQQAAGENIYIVGGGEIIDAVRRLDARYPADPVEMHWLCVDLLRVTFEMLAGQLPDWSRWKTRDQFRQLSVDPPNGGAHLVCVDAFYHRGCEAPLPESWETTTDAIAGWLAVLLGADELVLLKSCDADSDRPLRGLADAGIVDTALPDLADRLGRVRLVNFLALLDGDSGRMGTG
ncbi:protein kinase [Roseiconus nitratireducens]|uniref:Protein kinase n=1 Tax=Roseiconus nitratireducens TaxID=2605748 RepID=A0A5M6D9V5_9BACT|nr:protein kinase [Roseiconus nitratireducens]KAA5544304.1 protein kinase [Roseiconus nitratireducens]